MHHQKTVIIYHGSCPDGFGGAYAAWKKFGSAAEYIPVKHGGPVPEKLEGRDLFFIDFCYPDAIMSDLAKSATSLTVLDHHEGVRATATKYPGVFDTNHSGATIAWSYFHPETPVPTLLRYVEDGDLYRFVLPDARRILAYAYTTTDSFASFSEKNIEHWDMLVRELEDPHERERILATGAHFEQFHTHIVENGIRHAELVQFEGYECYLTGSTSEFRSDVGNRLARLKPPFSLIISADAKGLRVSLRGDGSVNVANIAQKYGGNGHPNSAGFEIPYGSSIPWQRIEKTHESTRD